MKKLWIGLGIIIVAIIIILAVKKPAEKTAVTGDAIKLGAVLSLTGPGIQDADTVKQGIDFAVADLKKHGANIEVIYSDDQTDPKNTISGLQYVKTQGAQAIIGFTWDFLFSAAAPILEQQQIVGLTATNTSEYTTKSNYGFYMAPKTSDAQSVLEQFFKDHNIKTISFIGTKFGFSDAHFKNLQAAAKNTGVTIISEDWLTFGSEVGATNALIPKVKTKNPDALFLIAGGDQALSNLFQKIQQQGIKVPAIAGTTTIGRFLHDNPTYVKAEYPVYSLTPKSSDKFIQYYQANHDGKTPGEYTEYAYDSVMVLYQALTQKKDISLRDALKQGTFKGYVNSYSYDENNNMKQGLWSLELVK